MKKIFLALFIVSHIWISFVESCNDCCDDGENYDCCPQSTCCTRCDTCATRTCRVRCRSDCQPTAPPVTVSPRTVTYIPPPDIGPRIVPFDQGESKNEVKSESLANTTTSINLNNTISNINTVHVPINITNTNLNTIHVSTSGGSASESRPPPSIPQVPTSITPSVVPCPQPPLPPPPTQPSYILLILRPPPMQPPNCCGVQPSGCCSVQPPCGFPQCYNQCSQYC